MSIQLLLPLEKRKLLSFESFYSDSNSMAYTTLTNWPQAIQMIYLQGCHGSGKTHLAEALTHKMLIENKQVLLVSGQSAPAPHFFYELPKLDLFILDDLDTLLNFSPKYEEALFTLYNHIFDQPQTKLLLTSTAPIAQLPLKLKDLYSRLQSMLLLKLHPPSAEALESIMTKQAKRLQLALTPEMMTLLMQQRHAHPVHMLNNFVQQCAQDKKKPSLTYLKHFLNLMIQ